MELELLSAVIADIYDAAVDPALWMNALRKTCDFVGGVQAVMFWQDAIAGNVVTLHEYNGDPHYTRLYYEVYAPLNPVFPAAIFGDVGSVVAATDLVPAPELHETRFHKEWIAPQGLGDSLGVLLEKDAARAAFLSMIWSGRNPIGEDEKRRMALLVPHYQRAVAVGRLFTKQKSENEALTATLDRVDSAVFLVSEGGNIVFANASGRKMLEQGTLLRASGNMLRAVAAEADRSLGDSYRALAADGANVHARGVTVVLFDSPGERWIANVLPLIDGERQRAGNAYNAIAAVFVRNSLRADPTPLEILARRYGLTASEIRVAEAVLRVSGNDAIADALGIARTTVRTHLNHIYHKTGAANQSELIKLIAGLG